MPKPTRFKLLTAALTIAIAGTFLASSAAAGTTTENRDESTALAGFRIASQANGRCLTLAHFNTGNGAAVHMYDCGDGPTQRWTWNGPELRSDFNGKCLDVSIGNGDNGGLVAMYDCLGVPQQGWHPFGADLHTDINHRCLTIANENPWQGAAVVIADCVNSGHQKWFMF